MTTDFRDVLAEIAERHLRLPDARLAEVFPDFAVASGGAQRVLRA